jgi:serine/threonine-protein kinase
MPLVGASRMTDVFVSYKAEDRARIAFLVQALETDGLSVWWDAHIGGGDAWRETILRHLEAAKCVIVIWSRRSVGPKGEFVRDEASRALKRKTYFPVRIDKIDPPLGFGETQALDLTGWKGDRSDPRYNAVLSVLRQRFAIKAKRARSDPAEQKGMDRRALLAGGSVAALAVAGGGAWFLLRPTAAKSESIAVLPFENLSGDPSQAYFSDGIAEELRSALARIPGLKVVARTSSEAVRNADAQTAAAKLHVADILTGSVRRSAQMLRVSTQLIDGSDGTERWSEVYDRPLGDSLQIQSDIANRVTEALRIRIGPRDENFRAHGGTDNPRAQDLLLRADAERHADDTESGIRASLALVEAALSEDPKYGDAWTRKAGGLGELGTFFARSPAEAQSLMQQAQGAARQAVGVSPLSPAAHLSLGSQYFWRFQFPSALREFEKGQSLSGTSADDLAQVAWYVVMLRRFDVALSLADEAAALDPLNPGVHLKRATVLMLANKLPEAEQAVQRAMRLNSNLSEPHQVYAEILMKAGRLRQAQAEVAKIPWGSALVYKAILAERLGDRNESNRYLNQFQNSDGASTAHYQLAQIYAQQHRVDEAFAELDKAWAGHDPGLAGSQTDYLLDPIRNDPRFQALLKKLNFPA